MVQDSKAASKYTRAQAEKKLSQGKGKPEDFIAHPNYHVRRKAWVLLGRPIPEDLAGQTELAKSINLQSVISATA